MSLLKWRPGLLSAPVGNNHVNNPEDILNMKDAYARVGRYTKPVTNGYIDADLNNAINGIQRDYNLKRDGYMKPGGETEATLIGEALGIEKKPDPSGERPKLATAAPALAGILMRYAPAVLAAGPRIPGAVGIGAKAGVVLGAGAALAMDWWKDRSKGERESVLDDISNHMPTPPQPDDKQHCEDMHQGDTKECGDIKNSQIKAVCRACAMDRYSLCLKGYPKNQIPDLRY